MTSFRISKTSVVIALMTRNNIVISFQQSSLDNTIVKSSQFEIDQRDELISIHENLSDDERIVVVSRVSSRRIIVVSTNVDDFEFDD